MAEIYFFSFIDSYDIPWSCLIAQRTASLEWFVIDKQLFLRIFSFCRGWETWGTDQTDSRHWFWLTQWHAYESPGICRAMAWIFRNIQLLTWALSNAAIEASDALSHRIHTEFWSTKVLLSISSRLVDLSAIDQLNYAPLPRNHSMATVRCVFTKKRSEILGNNMNGK